MSKWLRKTLSVLTAGLCMAGAVNIPSVIPVSQVSAADYSYKGEKDGYYYEIWNMNSQGEVNYENTENNGFTFSWDNNEDSFALKGDCFGNNQIYASQIKEYNVTYDADVNYNGGSGYTGVYGWMTHDSNQMDYYIIDSWGSWRPHGDEHLGSFESNGITYDLYKQVRMGLGCFDMTVNLWNATYYSVARENLAENIDETCNIKNTINVADHFKAFEEAGLKLGYVYDAGFIVEGYRSSGNAKVNSLEIKKEFTEDTNFGPSFTNPKHDPVEPDVYGRTVYVDFENDEKRAGAGDESCTASYETDHSVSGERSMFISAEGDNARSFKYEIDPYDFNEKDMFGGLEIYNSSDDEAKFVFEISRVDGTGKEYKYSRYTKDITPGHWSAMDQLSFLINNEPFTRFYITVTPVEPVDFYVDNLYICGQQEFSRYVNSYNSTVRGDMNRDDAVDMFDVIALRRELLDVKELVIDPIHDVNGDYKLNIGDLVLLTRFVLGQEDTIPEPEVKGKYYFGNFNEDIDGVSYSVVPSYEDTGNVKTIVREDGTCMSQWDVKNYFQLSKTQIVDGAEDLRVRYSGKVKVSDNDSYNNVSMSTTYVFDNDGNTFTVFVSDGADEEDKLRWNSDRNDMKLVEIGGIEFYTDKNEDLDADVFTDNSLLLFTKDSLIDSDKLCSFEREIDFAEILKYAGKENFRPHEVSFSAEAKNSSGYIDFSEITLSGSSEE